MICEALFSMAIGSRRDKPFFWSKNPTLWIGINNLWAMPYSIAVTRG